MTSDFRQTWLWQNTFVLSRPDTTEDERSFFREQFLLMRDRVTYLVDQISPSIPGLTVHNVTHLDALWGTASLVAEGATTLTPPEGFVFGAAVLLHDSAMSLAAYPEGLKTIGETTEWRDAYARHKQSLDSEHPLSSQSEEEIQNAILPDVLRLLHASQSQILAEQGWYSSQYEREFLISDSDTRFFYGPTIGAIAHSHWWNIDRLEREFSQNLGALPSKTRHTVDKLKISCLLRIADALHLDQLRAPRFLRVLNNPSGVSAMHWSFQEKLVDKIRH